MNTNKSELGKCELPESGIALEQQRRFYRNKRACEARRARNQAMRDLGLVRVRGNLGGTYWE